MTLVAAVGALIRVFAIYLAATTVQGIPMLIGWADIRPLTPTENVVAGISVGLPLLTAFLLWSFNLVLARRIANGKGSSEALPEAPAAGLELVLFSGIGLWFCCRGLVDGAYWALYLWWGGEFSSFPATDRANMVVTALELVLGLFLVLRVRGLQALLLRMRGSSSP